MSTNTYGDHLAGTLAGRLAEHSIELRNEAVRGAGPYPTDVRLAAADVAALLFSVRAGWAASWTKADDAAVTSQVAFDLSDREQSRWLVVVNAIAHALGIGIRTPAYHHVPADTAVLIGRPDDLEDFHLVNGFAQFKCDDLAAARAEAWRHRRPWRTAAAVRRHSWSFMPVFDLYGAISDRHNHVHSELMTAADHVVFNQRMDAAIAYGDHHYPFKDRETRDQEIRDEKSRRVGSGWRRKS